MAGRHWFVAGTGLGAGVMFLLDPRTGRRRRARGRDRVVKAVHGLTEGAVKAGRDLAHRGRGLAARSRGLFEQTAPDEIVEERVRAALGRASSHPSAIEVVSDDGHVELHGHVLGAERPAILAAARHVRGVGQVDDHLVEHDEPGHVPYLQGTSSRPYRLGGGIRRKSWAPATRLVAGALGAGLLAAGLLGRRGPRWGPTGLGALLLARSVLNTDLRRLTGIGAGNRVIDVRKSLHVAAPVNEVFALWRNLESFPRFMSHVKEIRRQGDNRYHFRVGSFGWDAEVTRFEPDHLIAWRSVPRSVVKSRGSVRFDSDGHGGTRIDVQMSYNPPGGLLGHGIARLMGADAKKQMDDDLIRFKSLIEQGKATGRHETVTRAQVEQGQASRPGR